VLWDVSLGPRDPGRVACELIALEGKLRWMVDEAAALLYPSTRKPHVWRAENRRSA
jgi:hypothetical protein